MRPDVVVVVTPVVDSRTGIVERGEPVQVQTVLAELAVEAFAKRVLRRLPGLKETKRHTGPLRPEEHGLAG